jgi:O-antigen/teichoic acid export membrane protein
MRYVSAVGSRYGALAVQFLIVILVANRLTQSEAGLYFVAFGLVATFFSLCGLGLPDGLVISIGKDISDRKTEAIQDALRRSLLLGLGSGLLMFGVGAIGAIALGQGVEYSLMTAIWGIMYGMVFVASQGLIALRCAAMGTFFFYSATNLGFLFTSVPYLLLSESPTLSGLMRITIFAATLAAVSATIAVLRKARPYPGKDRATLAAPMRSGAVIAVSRMFQAMIYWVPIWITTFMLDASQAAVIATAGRLLIAVSAVIAALRFSVRPTIVAAAAAGDWAGIERLGRRIALGTTLFTLAAIIGLFLTGQPFLDFLLGPEYAAAWGILLVLLVGALGEAIGGPVDEVLKMTGQSRIVFTGLVVTVLLEVALGLALSPFGVIAVAWSQAIAFVGMYAFQILALKRRRGILIAPLPVRKRP